HDGGDGGNDGGTGGGDVGSGSVSDVLDSFDLSRTVALDIGGGKNRFMQFDAGGAVAHSIDTPGTSDNAGVALLGKRVFVADRSRGVAQLDPETGQAGPHFGPEGVEALGHDGSYLFVGL